MKRILFLWIILNLMPSCIPIPLFSSYKASIDQLQSQVKIGSTTREGVISMLGKPDLERDGYIIYLRREYESGTMMVRVFLNYSDNIAFGQEYMDLYFEFDNYGTLTGYQLDKYNSRLMPVKQK